jgi:hypothetical protein
MERPQVKRTLRAREWPEEWEWREPDPADIPEYVLEAARLGRERLRTREALKEERPVHLPSLMVLPSEAAPGRGHVELVLGETAVEVAQACWRLLVLGEPFSS